MSYSGGCCLPAGHSWWETQLGRVAESQSLRVLERLVDVVLRDVVLRDVVWWWAWQWLISVLKVFSSRNDSVLLGLHREPRTCWQLQNKKKPSNRLKGLWWGPFFFPSTLVTKVVITSLTKVVLWKTAGFGLFLLERCKLSEKMVFSYG